MDKKKVAKAADPATFIEELVSLRFDDTDDGDKIDEHKTAVVPMLYDIDLSKRVDDAKERYGHLRRRIFGGDAAAARRFKQWVEGFLGVGIGVGERWWYASRAWLKLDDICQQFPRLNLAAGVVVDLAANPGSFSEYVGDHFKYVERTIAVSLHGMTRLTNYRNVQCLRCDLQNWGATTNAIILTMNESETVSLVLADGALDSTNGGRETGSYSTDTHNLSLIQSEICVALSLLGRKADREPGGDFLLKTFGVKRAPTVQIIAQCAAHFRRTYVIKPRHSLDTNDELYVLFVDHQLCRRDGTRAATREIARINDALLCRQFKALELCNWAMSTMMQRRRRPRSLPSTSRSFRC